MTYLIQSIIYTVVMFLKIFNWSSLQIYTCMNMQYIHTSTCTTAHIYTYRQLLMETWYVYLSWSLKSLNTKSLTDILYYGPMAPLHWMYRIKSIQAQKHHYRCVVYTLYSWDKTFTHFTNVGKIHVNKKCVFPTTLGTSRGNLVKI